MQRSSHPTRNGNRQRQKGQFWLSPSDAAQWPPTSSVSLPGLDLFPSWVDLFNFLMSLSMGSYLGKDSARAKKEKQQLYSNVSQVVNITESSCTSGPVVMYTREELAKDECGDHKSSSSSNDSPDVSFMFSSKGDSAISQGEALSWPSFRYLLFCDKSVIWSHFLNALPVGNLCYRGTRSLPSMKSDKLALLETKDLKVRKRLKRARNRSIIDFQDNFLSGDSSFTKFTYNVDALVVDSPSIFESRNAYHRVSFRQSLDSFTSTALEEKPRVGPDTQKVRHWTSCLILTFMYGLIILIVCRLGFLLAVLAYNSKPFIALVR